MGRAKSLRQLADELGVGAAAKDRVALRSKLIDQGATETAGSAGWHPITYMSGTCVSKLLFNAAGKNANGVFTVTPLLDPADPKNAANPAMKLYQEQFAKYFPPKGTENNPSEGIIAYGWTTAALLVKTLEAANRAIASVNQMKSTGARKS